MATNKDLMAAQKLIKRRPITTDSTFHYYGSVGTTFNAALATFILNMTKCPAERERKKTRYAIIQRLMKAKTFHVVDVVWAFIEDRNEWVSLNSKHSAEALLDGNQGLEFWANIRVFRVKDMDEACKLYGTLDPAQQGRSFADTVKAAKFYVNNGMFALYDDSVLRILVSGLAFLIFGSGRSGYSSIHRAELALSKYQDFIKRVYPLLYHANKSEWCQRTGMIACAERIMDAKPKLGLEFIANMFMPCQARKGHPIRIMADEYIDKLDGTRSNSSVPKITLDVYAMLEAWTAHLEKHRPDFKEGSYSTIGRDALLKTKWTLSSLRKARKHGTHP